MKLVPGMTVLTGDNKVFDMSHRTADNYIVAVNPRGDARLFKPNGHYAGADREKNAIKEL